MAGLAGAGYAHGLRVAPDHQSLTFAVLFASLVVTALLAVLVSRRIGPVEH